MWGRLRQLRSRGCERKRGVPGRRARGSEVRPCWRRGSRVGTGTLGCSRWNSAQFSSAQPRLGSVRCCWRYRGRQGEVPVFRLHPLHWGSHTNGVGSTWVSTMYSTGGDRERGRREDESRGAVWTPQGNLSFLNLNFLIEKVRDLNQSICLKKKKLAAEPHFLRKTCTEVYL